MTFNATVVGYTDEGAAIIRFVEYPRPEVLFSSGADTFLGKDDAGQVPIAFRPGKASLEASTVTSHPPPSTLSPPARDSGKSRRSPSPSTRSASTSRPATPKPTRTTQPAEPRPPLVRIVSGHKVTSLP